MGCESRYEITAIPLTLNNNSGNKNNSLIIIVVKIRFTMFKMITLLLPLLHLLTPPLLEAVFAFDVEGRFVDVEWRWPRALLRYSDTFLCHPIVVLCLPHSWRFSLFSALLLYLLLCVYIIIVIIVLACESTVRMGVASSVVAIKAAWASGRTIQRIFSKYN